MEPRSVHFDDFSHVRGCWVIHQIGVFSFLKLMQDPSGSFPFSVSRRANRPLLFNFPKNVNIVSVFPLSNGITRLSCVGQSLTVINPVGLWKEKWETPQSTNSRYLSTISNTFYSGISESKRWKPCYILNLSVRKRGDQWPIIHGVCGAP